MRIFTITILAILIISCNDASNKKASEREKGIDNKEKRNENWSWVTDLNGENGEWVRIGENNTIENGRFTNFYYNGNIRTKGKLKNGELVDTLYSFDLEGKLLYYERNDTFPKFRYYYKKNGEVREYYPTGEILQKSTINNHLEAGVWNNYYKNGAIWKYGNYNNGNGWNVFLYPSGGKKDSSYWIDGYQTGEARFWYENGKLKEISNWKKSKQHGSIKRFYKNGTLKYIAHNKSGILNGKYEEYYKNGSIKISVGYIEGKKQGKYFQYWENGNLMIEEDYLNDSLVGEQKYYYESGQLYSSGIKTVKELNEKCSVYTHTGELWGIEYFENGKTVDWIELKELSPKEEKEVEELLEKLEKMYKI